MNNTIKAVTASLSLLAFSSAVLAEEFSYDYVDVGYTHSDVKTSTSDLNYNGYVVKGVKEVADNIHVFGEYMDIRRTDNVGLALKTIGAGYHHLVSVDIDLVIDVYRTKWNDVNDPTNSGNFNSGKVKLRHNFSDDLELLINYEKHNTIDYDGFSIGAVKKINNDFSVVFDYASLNRSDSTVDWDMTTLSFRHYY